MVRIVSRALIPSILFVCTLPAGATPARYSIGLIGGITGPVAPYGMAAKNGLFLALERNGAGDLITVRLEDDQFVPSRTVSAYRKLKSSGRLDIVMATGSTPALAIAPLTNRDGMPFIACASDDRVARGYSNILRSWTSGKAEGEAVARLVRGEGTERVALVYATDDYSRAVMAGTRAALGRDRIVIDAEFPQEDQDFKPLLGRIRASKVETAVLCLNAGQPGLFALQASQLQISLRLFGCVTLESNDEREQSKGTLSGARYAAIPIAGWFEQLYRERFGNDSVISVAAAFYDTGAMLSEFAKQGVPAGSIMEAFDRLGAWNGVVGQLAIETDSNGRGYRFALSEKTVLPSLSLRDK